MEIIKINSKKIEKEKLQTVIKLLKKGKIIIFPTDTVYGIIADSQNKKAIEKIFKIKKRLKVKPLPVFVKDLKSAKKIAKIDKSQEKFIKSKWPGKFTFVFKRKPAKIYGIGKKTIGIRIPNYRILNKLLEKFKKPLIQTSANISGKGALTNIKKVLKEFKNQKNRPDLVINAGKLKKSKQSTVIDLIQKKQKILRK